MGIWTNWRVSEWVKLSAFFGWFMHVVSGHSVCWRFGSRDPGFEFCIQQRKTTILLPNRYHFTITSASKLVQTNMLVYWCMSTCKVSTPRLTDSYPDQLLDSEWFLVKSSPGDGWMMFPHWFEGGGRCINIDSIFWHRFRASLNKNSQIH